MATPLTKGFRWHNYSYFPLPAYHQVVQDLKRRPDMHQAEQAWEIMSNNFEAWSDAMFPADSPFFLIFAKIVLQAWEAYETANKRLDGVLTPPGIVSTIRRVLTQTTRYEVDQNAMGRHNAIGMEVDAVQTSTPTSFADPVLPYGMGMQDNYVMMGSDSFSGMTGQSLSEAHMNHFDWAAMGGHSSWGGF